MLDMHVFFIKLDFQSQFSVILLSALFAFKTMELQIYFVNTVGTRRNRIRYLQPYQTTCW